MRFISAPASLPPFWQPGGSTQHLLGTDQLGRDILSRLIAGARISLATATAAVAISGVFGVIAGLIAGYVGGIVEVVVMRIVDAFLALPFILLALALVATLGSGFGNIVMVMVIANWARYARLVRSEVISIKQRDFVTLARIAGVGPVRIMLRHVLPNALNSVVVLAILDVGRAIILEVLVVVSWRRYTAARRVVGPDARRRSHFPRLRLVADHAARPHHRIAVLCFNSLGRWLRIRARPAWAIVTMALVEVRDLCVEFGPRGTAGAGRLPCRPGY